MTPGPEAEIRRTIDRMLALAGWLPEEVVEEAHNDTGRLDYRLGDLCILEAKRPTSVRSADALKLHLQQAQRYGRSDSLPFLMVSDGELHFIQDRRNSRIERLFALPTPQELASLLADESVLVDGYIVTPSSLFDFQREAVYSVVRRIFDGDERMLLEMATGTGKTLIAAEIIKSYARVVRERRARHVSVMFLVDRDALEDQSADRLGAHLVELKVNTVYALDDARVDVLVAQVATMQHRFDRPPFHRNYFDLIIVDEAHRSVHGGVWRQVLEAFDCPQVGLTATPPRLTDDETIEYFGPPVFLYSYEQGVRDGLLAPAVIHRVLTTVDRDGIAADGRLYTSEDFGVRLLVENRDRAIVDYYSEHFYGKKALVFAASSVHAESLWERFNEIFVAQGDPFRCEFVLSSVESALSRRRLVEDFKRVDSDLRVLINLNILTAGFDFPELDLLFMCRSTRHKSLYLQMRGRGSRLPLDAGGHLRLDELGHPVKDRFYMIDFVGVTDWETRDFEPTVHVEAEVERTLNSDPVAEQEPILAVDVPVEIVAVTVIDPFAAVTALSEETLTRELREAKAALAKSTRAQQDLLLELQHAIEEARATRRSAFRQLVHGLHTAAPLTPLSAEVLRSIAPELCDVSKLNESFGVDHNELQQHIDDAMNEVP